MDFGGIEIRTALFIIGLMCLIMVGASTIEDAQRNLDRMQSESNSRISSPSISFDTTHENLNKISSSSTALPISPVTTTLPTISIESIIASIERNLGIISSGLGGSAGTMGSGSAPSGWPSGVPYHQELVDMLK